MLEIVLIVLIAVLWRLGGLKEMKWSGFRDVLVPVTLTLYYWFTCNFWAGLLTGGFANSIRIGYGSWDPEHDSKPSFLAKVTKDREGWIIRGLYGAITSFCIGIMPTLYYYGIFYGIYVPETFVRFGGYIVFNVIIEVALNKFKANVWWTELVNGAARGSVILWVR